MDSLVLGAEGVPEGLHESLATGMASRSMATLPRQPSAQVPSQAAPLPAHLIPCADVDLVCHSS